jgi:hypothetical protein
MSDPFNSDIGNNPFSPTPSQNAFSSRNSVNLFGKPKSPDLYSKIADEEEKARTLGVNVPDETGKKWSLWDVLNIARQPITNMIYEVASQSKDNKLGWDDVDDILRAGLFGIGADLPGLGNLPGMENYRKTSSDVIEVLFPNAPKWIKKIGGFVGDVLTDPLTYLSFGASTLGKATGKAAGTALASRVSKQIAEDASGKVAEGLISKYGGKTWSEALQRAATQESKQVGNYGLRLGIPFTDKGMTIAKGSPTDWVGNLLSSMGATDAGKAVQGIATSIPKLPLIKNINAAFNTKAGLGPFGEVKDLTKDVAARTSAQLEIFRDTITAFSKEADIIGKSPEFAAFLTSKNVKNITPNAQGAVELVRQWFESVGKKTKKMANAVATGKATATIPPQVPPFLKPLADQVQNMTDTIWKQFTDRKMIDASKREAFYFPRFYERNGQVSVLTLQDNPVSAGFLKNRQLKTIKDAEAKGYKPIDAIQSLNMYMERSAKIINNFDMVKDVVVKYGREIPDKKNLSVLNRNPLTKEGFTTIKVPGFEHWIVPEEVAKVINATHDIMLDPNELTKAAEFINGIQNVWKRMATILRPGFHLRNAQSNVWTYAFKDGISPKNAELYQKAVVILGGKGKQDLLEITLNGQKVSKKLDEWYRIMRSSGVDTGTFTVADLQPTKLGVEQAKNVAQKVWQAPGKLAEKAGASIENSFRVASALSDMNKGLNVTQASHNVGKWFINYGDKTPTEESLSKLLPFYMWMKNNLVNQLQAFVTNPGKYSMFSIKPMTALDFSTDEEKQLRPEWQKQSMAINVLGQKDAQGNPVFTSSPFPFTDINQYAEHPLRSILDTITGAISPLIKTPAELLANKSFYNGAQIARNAIDTAPAPIALEPFIMAIPNAVKERLNIVQDENGRWNLPAKWAYAITQLIPLANVVSPFAAVAGANASEYESSKAPWQVIGQTTGITQRPVNVVTAKEKQLQTRLAQLRMNNSAKLEQTMNEMKRKGQVPNTMDLATFKKMIGMD